MTGASIVLVLPDRLVVRNRFPVGVALGDGRRVQGGDEGHGRGGAEGVGLGRKEIEGAHQGDGKDGDQNYGGQL